MPDVWSTLVYDKKTRDYATRLALPTLADCYIKWTIDPDGIEGPLEDERPTKRRGETTLVVKSASKSGPGVEQRQAFDFLLANEAKVGKSVLKYLLEETKESYWDQVLPPADDTSPGDKKRIKRLQTAVGFRELVELTGVTILGQSKDCCAYVVFDFNSALDEEHGFSVLMHRDQPLSFAGSGEQGGGPPPEKRAAIDWEALQSQAADYLTLLTTIKNVPTATEALPKVRTLNPGFLHVCQAFTDLQTVARDDCYSPRGMKLVRTLSAVSDQYIRLGKKDDIVAVLNKALGGDAKFCKCVELARKHR